MVQNVAHVGAQDAGRLAGHFFVNLQSFGSLPFGGVQKTQQLYNALARGQKNVAAAGSAIGADQAPALRRKDMIALNKVASAVDTGVQLRHKA